jgi:flagellar biogenesis protein FliO
MRMSLLVAASLIVSHSAFAQTNTVTTPLTVPSLPDTAPSFLRVIGALIFVLGLFLGAIWLFKNWQRVGGPRGRTPKLNVLETRSLGGRHAVFVVGYERERFLIASSPAGVNLLSHLPPAVENEAETAPTHFAPPSFAQALTQVLKGGKQ